MDGSQERRVEWDEDKRLNTLKKHQIDFIEAAEVLFLPCVRYPSPRGTSYATWPSVHSGTETSSRSSTSNEKDVCVSSRQDGHETMSAMRIYTRSELRKLKGKTDWAAVEALTDEQIEAAAAADPDWAEFQDIDWSKAELVVPARKVAISIRLDSDLVDFFKGEGAGYQRRINQVLRTYVEHRKKAG